MHSIFSNPAFHKYCSQQGASSFSFHTIEEGIKIIETLLEKKTLCRHDVINLNQVYQTLDELDKSPEKNSRHALLQVVQKMETLRHEALAEQIITAYHLQQFKIFPLAQTVTSFFNSPNLTLEKMKDIAHHLPLCESEQIFDADVAALIGTNYSTDIAAVLKAKKSQFCQYLSYYEELKQLRENNPSLYPSYLEEILNGGFFNLYDHLIAMKALPTHREKKAAIEKLSFHSFAKIILEFREAVLLKMEKMIPQERGNIIFLLGNTRSGKSTTFCYLRKDLMVLDGLKYRSSDNKDHLIGNDSDISYTLLPNIAVSSNLVFVDFPGFNDTHGQVISMAIEITLKALVKKYSPQIMLLISIKDTESGGNNRNSLCERLTKVLGTLDNCILGLTKYSQDGDFIKIQEIEKMQEQQRSCRSEEEIKLETKIKGLLKFIEKNPGDQEAISKLRKKAERLAKCKEARLSLPADKLPMALQKLEHKENLSKKEEDFKNKTKIQSLIPFADLTDQIQLGKILEQLSALKNVELTQMDNSLDTEGKALIETLFNNDLSHIIKSREDHSLSSSMTSTCNKDTSKDTPLKDIEAFEQSILETSLINTILSKSYPEIGRFFHLEEMDLALIREYDKKVIEDCIDGYIKDVILGFLLAKDVIEKFEKKYSKQQSQEIDKVWSLLKKYVPDLQETFPKNASSDKVKEAWESLEKECQQRLEGTEKELELPGWLKAVLLIPLGIPYSIFSMVKKIKLDKASKEIIEETDQKLHQSIKAIGQAVIALKDIENIVSKKAQFDKVFSSYPLSLDSIASLQTSLENQITEVKNIYGKDKWEERVSNLSAQLKLDFSSIRSGYPLGETLLYALISQEVSWEKLPPYFDKSMSFALIYSFIKVQKKSQEIHCLLTPNWKASSYKELSLSDPSYFFHSLSVTEQEHYFLMEQGKKLFAQSSKNPIKRLLLADVIYKLWKELPPINENTEKRDLDSSIQHDEMKILRAIKDNEWILEYSKKWLRSNSSFILRAVKANRKAFKFATDDLKNDREFVLANIKDNGLALEYASEMLKNDKEVVLTAIKDNRLALEYASETLKNDKEVVLTAIKDNGLALEYASETLKNDKEVVLTAIK
ncbi:MAG: DUF4116 domain-containing protein, partial [Candidatus Rhabdochlamydia sp.]